VQVTQPIFQGGRLYHTYKQASANSESLQAKYGQVREDVLYNVREATYNLIRAMKTQDVYGEAIADLETEKKRADRLFGQDTITRQAYLTITGQYSQAVYARQASDAELESRLWQWTAALGLKQPPVFRPLLSLPIDRRELSLEECLNAARASHPELLYQQKVTEAARQGEKVSKSLYMPNVSVNGFYGRSGGAFEGETLRLGEDWLAAIQITQYFGLSTFNLSGFDQHTSPQIGQSTRTAAKTVNSSLDILNAYKPKIERREAEVTYEQALVQLDRTRMEVENNVREAYANWKKALSQLQIAETGVPLATSEFSIARIKSAHRESPYSDRATARNRLAQAQAAFIQAQADYNIAQAALNRAMGPTIGGNSL
jgi:outer membrane protein